ncbi:hypothetical protein NMG60_11013869 [Bertholletia excelsa]
MELRGRSTARNGPVAEWGLVGSEPGLKESVRGSGLWRREFLYPERPGVPDCAYFMRTGSCGYGVKCRYNHPRDRSLVGSAVRLAGGEYPERAGEPACQFFLKTGTCKFGASCKFDHPINSGGSISNTQLNNCGYPLRPGEKECSYYLKTGQCKFGVTCKFHHPRLGGESMLEAAQPFYQKVQSSAVPSPDQNGGMLDSYRTASSPVSYVPSAYGPVLLSPAIVQFPGWSPYSGPVSPVFSPSAPSSAGTGSMYGVTQLSSSVPSFAGAYPSFPSRSGHSSNSKKDKVFPERPGQPDCQYYLKTGDCKFRSSCKYNHPPDWMVSITNSVLGPSGLPLRPGVLPCAFYLKNGYCKFGCICRFDHPVGTMRYRPSASSLIDMPGTPYMFGSSLAALAPFLLHSELISVPKLNSGNT